MSKQITEADVDAALARRVAGAALPKEPDLWDLYHVRTTEQTDPRFHRTLIGRNRVRKNYSRDLRSRGKHCRSCGAHFVPKRIDGVCCPECREKQRATQRIA